MPSFFKAPLWTSSCPDEARALLHQVHGIYAFSPAERLLALLYVLPPAGLLAILGHLLARLVPQAPPLRLPLLLGICGLLLGARAALRIRRTVATVSRTAVVLSADPFSRSLSYNAFGRLALQPSWPFPLLVIHTLSGRRESVRIPRALFARLAHALISVHRRGNSHPSSSRTGTT